MGPSTVAKARLQQPSLGVCQESEAIAYHGVGASQESSAPRPRLPSSPSILVTAMGVSAKLHECGWVGLARPKRLRNWPARACSPSGSAVVVA